MANMRPKPQVMRLSDAAAARIKELLAQSQKPITGVRVGVKNGGCAGMAYTMEYAEQIAPTDEIVEDKGVRIFGTTRDKGPIVAFDVQGAHPHDIATIIDHSGVAVRAGTHCTMPLLARYGVSATCRASFGLYNTAAEVDSLAQALMKAQDFFA